MREMNVGVRGEARQPFRFTGSIRRRLALFAISIVVPLFVVFAVVTVWQRMFGLP